MSEAILVKGNRPIDLTPTTGSSNLVTSGGVAQAIENSTEVHVGNDAPKGNETIWFHTNAGLVSRVVNTSTAYVLLNDATIHVDNLYGSDDSGDGTSESPFATIGHVIGILPKNLNGFNVTIKFDGFNGEDGVFENIKLTGFYGGELIFDGLNIYNYDMSKINVTNCTLVRFKNLHLNINSLEQVNSNVYIENSEINITDAETGIKLKAVSHFITDEKSVIKINGCTTGIHTMELSKMYIHDITGGFYEPDIDFPGGINVNDGIIADSGSTVNITTTSLMANTLYSTSSGGTISVNAQPTIANY